MLWRFRLFTLHHCCPCVRCRPMCAVHGSALHCYEPRYFRCSSNEAPPTAELLSGASTLTPIPMYPGFPLGVQVTEVFPSLFVGGAAGDSPVGLVFTVTRAFGTG